MIEEPITVEGHLIGISVGENQVILSLHSASSDGPLLTALNEQVCVTICKVVPEPLRPEEPLKIGEVVSMPNDLGAYYIVGDRVRETGVVLVLNTTGVVFACNPKTLERASAVPVATLQVLQRVLRESTAPPTPVTSEKKDIEKD
jgi:hypothetical protein